MQNHIKDGDTKIISSVKLNDSETENTETEVHLNFSKDFKYITPEEFEGLISENTEVGKLIYNMIVNPEKFM